VPLLISRAARARLALSGSEPGGPAGEVTEGGGRIDLSDPARARAAAAPVVHEGVGGGVLSALDRLSSAFELLVDRYLEDTGGGALTGALGVLDRRLGRGAVDALLEAFGEEFVLSGKPRDAGLAGFAGFAGEAPDLGAEEPHRLASLRALLLFWWLDVNPAAASAIALLFAGSFRERPLLQPVLAVLRSELSRPAGDQRWPAGLVGALLEPVRRAPTSLAEQLRLAGENWGAFLPDAGAGLLRGADLVDEETPRLPPGPQPDERPIEEPSFAGLGEERRFTPDRAWMPELVLVAKNARVWLHQLSRRHGLEVRRLDQIPDRELAELARRGFGALWLIGIWERSTASARIKRLAGNPEALGSAYSILRYRIADELGGDEALEALGARAAQHGLRLAADMVPNHFALDSDWVIEHPERFVGTEECPYPGYSFEGPELSPHPGISLRIEDGYWDRSDAAVVFRRRDLATGRTRYLYHGNDGTGTPWNDTAQLDFLRPDVREAVTEQILEVARRFPVVRFDAAMTLARRHFQRLWYPPPGGGGAIPSRAERGLNPAEFSAAMPEEFWRSLVDRAAERCPETLLLAEAFWLMEGYFVRTLGMHRVYNSAFMNLLRNGETRRFRELLAETLAFDPAVLERYVNFMSNPDERTAEEQFGTGDRYFGVCTILSTLPGLPMFAHGQFEGLRERYGMEYARPYVDEEADAAVLERHRRQIVPLLSDRRLFAAGDRFQLFEMHGAGGEVEDEVLAYANGLPGQPVLVAYHHGGGEVGGRLGESLPVRRRAGEPAEAGWIGEALGIAASGVVSFRDRVSGLSYLARAEEIWERGLELRLGPFEARVLEGFELAEAAIARASLRPGREVAGRGLAERLAEGLGAGGVPDLARAVRELELEPVRSALGRMLEAPVFRELAAARSLPDDGQLDRLEATILELARDIAEWAERRLDPAALGGDFHSRARGLLLLPVVARALARSRISGRREVGSLAVRLLGPEVLAGLAWRLGVEVLVTGMAGERSATEAASGAEVESEDPVTAWELERSPAPALAGLARRRGWGAVARLPLAGEAAAILERWLTSGGEIAEATGRHDFADESYVRLEALEAVVGVRLGAEVLAWSSAPTRDGVEALVAWTELAAEILQLAERAGYRVGELVGAAGEEAAEAEAPEP
jgi:hypothetical protein